MMDIIIRCYEVIVVFDIIVCVAIAEGDDVSCTSYQDLDVRCIVICEVV